MREISGQLNTGHYCFSAFQNIEIKVDLWLLLELFITGLTLVPGSHQTTGPRLSRTALSDTDTTSPHLTSPHLTSPHISQAQIIVFLFTNLVLVDKYKL